MMTIREYKRVESLEEAWELNQKKANRVIGGMIWLKMSRGNVGTAIDISGLGLDQIEETEDAFEIGAMVTLRQLEEHPGLAAYTDGAMRESVRHIVGCAASELATVGMQYLWQIWIFRCPDDVPGDGHRSGTLQSWTDAVGGICKTDRRSGHFSQINCP